MFEDSICILCRNFFYGNLLTLDKKRTELSTRKDDEDNYIEIPRMFIRYKIKLIPIDSLKNRDDGLGEAVAASTSWFRFSDKPFRLCNLISYRCEFRNNLFYWDCYEKDEFESEYFQNKVLKKGHLKLLDICEKDFVKLSESAKKYFVQGFKEYDKRGNPVYIYHPDIPRTYVREYEEKLFWNRLYIPDGELYLKRKNLITGSITKENANSGIMKAGKQAATANGNEMYNTNKFELRLKLNCQKLSMNILNQSNLAHYFKLTVYFFSLLALLKYKS